MKGDRIDHHRAIELLRAAVLRRGADECVSYCAYAGRATDGPCIVGQALLEAGWTLEDLGDLDRGGVDAPTLGSWSLASDDPKSYDYLGHRLPGVTRGAYAVFGAAQRVQDNRKSWGEALAAARLRYSTISLP